MPLYKQPCNDCGSSDALTAYEDHTTCYACNTQHWSTNDMADLSNPPALRPVIGGTFASIGDRKINIDTCRKYGVKVVFGTDGAIAEHQYPWFDKEKNLVGYKVRKCATKDFFTPQGTQGIPMGLFGQQTCSGRGKYITITEGEVDCLTVSQAFGNKYDVVSVRNGASGAVRELKDNLMFLEGYDHIVLCFDQDEAGRAATKLAQELFSPNKCKVVSLPLKDANEMVKEGRGQELLTCWWDAKTFSPEGILHISETWDRLLEYRDTPNIPYPWNGLNELLLGQRTREIVIWAAETGVGKSQVLRELAYNIIHTTNETVGMLMLEESIAKTTLGFMSFEAGRPLHKSLHETPQAELRGYWEQATRGDRFVLLDSRGWGNDIDTLKARIRYMAKAMGCRWIILDHLTIVLSSVQGASGDWAGIDELMTDLVALVHELDIGLHLVSHVSEGRNLRGSKGISKLADAIIFLERDKHEENPELRDITKLVVDKNRFAGDTGTGGYLKYSRVTGRMNECPSPVQVSETEF